MPYELHWQDEEHKIMQVDILDPVSWEEWHVTLNTLVETVKQADQRVDIIFNNTVGIPPGNPLPHLKTTILKLKTAPNIKMIVFSGNLSVANFVKSLINIVIRAMPVTWNPTMEFVTSLDEGLAMIAQDRIKQDVAV